jgi:hypothetical protein
MSTPIDVDDWKAIAEDMKQQDQARETLIKRVRGERGSRRERQRRRQPAAPASAWHLCVQAGDLGG